MGWILIKLTQITYYKSDYQIEVVLKKIIIIDRFALLFSFIS